MKSRAIIGRQTALGTPIATPLQEVSMIAQDVEELYRRHVRTLSTAKQLQLLARVAQELSEPVPGQSEGQRSLLELEGLGADLWEGVDAQSYVDEFRREWDQDP